MSYRIKKALVTGADGFIGSHLVEFLIKNNISVKAFAYYNSFNSAGWLDHIHPKAISNLEIFMGDIRDPQRVKQAIEGCDIIFHLASLIAIPYSYLSPRSYIDTNVTGTLNVLQMALETGVERVIHTSTSEVYGTAQYVPIDEKHPLNPQSPYAASKIGADMIAQSYYYSFGLPVAIVRPFNVYGPRQSQRAVIPTIITQALTDRQIKLGSITPTRDFTFVDDTVAAFLKIATSAACIGDVYNVGSNYEISIGDIVKKIEEILCQRLEIVFDKNRQRPQSSEVDRLWANSQKMRKATGWAPQINLNDGLAKTIDWMRNNLKKYKPGEYTI